MATNVADKLQIEETLAPDDTLNWKSFTSDKSVQIVYDQQNGSYSNQVSFDLSSIISTQGWPAVQEGYVLMPMSTVATFGTALTGPAAGIPADFLTIKDNFINSLDSIQFFVDGKQLIEQTSFSNFPLQIIDKLTMSSSDLVLEGEALNICPDVTTSCRYSAGTATSGGDGYTTTNSLRPRPMQRFLVIISVISTILSRSVR